MEGKGSSRGSTAALWLATALLTLLGLQLLRGFLAAAAFYLHQGLKLHPLIAAGITLWALALSFLALPAVRRLGRWKTLNAAGTGVVALRLAEQGCPWVPLDLLLAGLGTGLFALFLPVAWATLARWGTSRAWGMAVASGLVADTSLHAATRTVGLSWAGGGGSLLATVLLGVAALAALFWSRRPWDGERETPPSFPFPWTLALTGPWFYLQLVGLQNLGRATSLTGLALPWAALLVVAGGSLGLLVALWTLGKSSPPWLGGFLGGVGLVSLLLPTDPDFMAALFVVLGGAATVPLLPLALAPGSGGEIQEIHAEHRHFWIHGTGFFLLGLLLFVHYGSFQLPLPGSQDLFLGATLAALAVGSWVAARRWREERPVPRSWAERLAPFVVWLGPLALWISWNPPRVTAPETPPTAIRLLAYNIHMGFDLKGQLALQELAATMEDARPDVIALQEVSRGWVVAGSVDLLEWLGERLGMTAVFGPTADRQWGNALLSRYPIRRTEAGALPPDSLRLRRGYLDAEIDLGDETLRVLATHLHNPRNASAVRVVQVEALLRGWGGSERTVLLGDLNATPDSPEIQLLAAAGWRDAALGLPEPLRLTHPSFGPNRQIDYIWTSPDLQVLDFAVLPSAASDHLPVVATVAWGGGEG